MAQRANAADLQFSGFVALLAFAACLIAGGIYTWRSPFWGPPSRPQIEVLGDLIFNDTNLSEPKGLSCGTCHDARLQRQGNNGSHFAAVAKGSRDGVFGRRNVPSILYASFIPPFTFEQIKDDAGLPIVIAKGGLFLDGRAQTLEQQAEGPLFNALEMNNSSKAALAQKLAKAPYANLFREIYGSDVFADPDAAVRRLGEAVAAYERTAEFAPFQSKFDRVLEGKAVFTAAEQRGFDVFKDPETGNCISCHAGDTASRKPQDWLFTDYTYDALGVPRARIPANDNVRFFDLGLCASPHVAGRVVKGFNLAAACGAYRVPTLRNVAVTGPYFHNGSVTNLREAVSFYATRDSHPDRWYPKKADRSVAKFNDLPGVFAANVNTGETPYRSKANGVPRLDDKDIDALVAFLETLTDPQSGEF